MLLALALQSVPNMSKDKLADLLAVTSETMDSVLSGKEPAPAARWSSHLSFLARQADIPTLRQKLRKIDMFLLHENAEKKKARLRETLMRVAGSEYQYFEIISSAVQKTSEDNMARNTESMIDHIVLQKDTSPSDDWHFVFYRFSGDVDRYMLRDIVASQISYVNKTNSRLTIVTESREIRDLFCEDYYRRQTEKDAMAEISPDLEPLPPISLLLVDPNTWEGTGELVELEDADGFDDCP